MEAATDTIIMSSLFSQGEGQTFDYPDLESKITTLDSEEKAKSDLEESKNKRQTAQLKSSHVPGWFS